MEKREDRRILRTRGMLLDALLDLMIEKGYEAITIQDIIDRANVGRSTFYAHFQDKEQLLAASVGQLREFLRHQVMLQKEAAGASQAGTAGTVGQEMTEANAGLETQTFAGDQAGVQPGTGVQAGANGKLKAGAQQVTGTQTETVKHAEVGAKAETHAAPATHGRAEVQLSLATTARVGFRWEYSLPLFQHIQSHKRVYRATVGGSTPSAAVMQHMQTMIAELFEDQIGRMPHKPEHIPGEILAAFTVGTFLTLVAWWMDQPKPCTAEEVDRMFHRLTLTGLSG